MNTTVLFVEILIIGIQGGSWTILIVLSIFGFEWIVAIEPFLKDLETVISLCALTIFYSLGVILDRAFEASARIFNPTKLILSSSWVNERAKNLLRDDRVRVHSLDGTLAEYQHYILNRLRIARATFYNVFLFMISSLAFIFIRLNFINYTVKLKIVLSILILGALFVALCLVAWSMLAKTFEIRSQQIQMLLDKNFKT